MAAMSSSRARRASRLTPSRIGEIGNQVAGVAKAHALESAGQEAAAPVVIEKELAARFAAIAGGHDHERGQIIRFAAQAVGKPGPQAGPARNLGARQEEGHARGMIDGFGVHAAHQADVIGKGADVRQHLAHASMPRLAIAFVRLDRRADRASGHSWPTSWTAACCRGSISGMSRPDHGPQHRLVVEQVDVRGAAALPEHDDAFGLRSKVRHTRAGPVGRHWTLPAPSSEERAARPTPDAVEPKNWRRVTRAIFSSCNSVIECSTCG